MSLKILCLLRFQIHFPMGMFYGFIETFLKTSFSSSCLLPFFSSALSLVCTCMFLLTTQWIFNKGVHGTESVAGLQLFYNLGIALHCPANGHLSHLIFNMYLLCLVLMYKIFSFTSEILSWHLATSFLSLVFILC